MGALRRLGVDRAPVWGNLPVAYQVYYLYNAPLNREDGVLMTALALERTDLRLADAFRAHWRAWALLGAMAVLWLAAVAGITAESANPRPQLEKAEATSPEIAQIQAVAVQTSATALRQVNPLTALAMNAAIPVSQLAGADLHAVRNQRPGSPAGGVHLHTAGEDPRQRPEAG